ncbi:hypothetical protein [Candidatus Poriferisocius sp.]|uniref:hypothetical protein n=1 Tax=Candidatus Poriferisocius sp. TaxID=3101276 RepID=UPI003B011985
MDASRLFDPDGGQPLVLRRARVLFAGWQLSVSGNDELADWKALLGEALRTRFASNESTAKRSVAELRRFFRYLVARDANRWADVTPELVDDWYWAPRPDRRGHVRPAKTTSARNRQWAAQAILEEARSLGAPVDPAGLVGERIKPPQIASQARPLTAEEARLVQTYADWGLAATRRSLIVPFAFAGGTAAEIAGVRMCDVDLDAATVEFAGPEARTNPLTGWGAETVARFLRLNPPADVDALICVSGRTGPRLAAHSVTDRLGDVLRDAGLSGRAGVTPRSIRLTTARLILETEGIVSAARFLGSPSLDNTAHALGYSWRHRDAR